MATENIESEVTGTVWKIECKVGDEVVDGDTLMILESMKMETEVNAPKDGFINAVFVEEGDAVEVDDLLFSLE